MPQPVRAPEIDPAEVVTKAVLRASDFLGMSRAQLARTLGWSEATLSRVAAGRLIDPASKQGEASLLLIRVFRSLDALFGGNLEQARLWFTSHNHHLNGTPRELVQSLRGLNHVADYLDAMRR